MSPWGSPALRILVLALGLHAVAPAAAEAQGPPGEDAAPAVSSHGVEVLGMADLRWTVETLEGEPVPVSDFRGEVLVVNAWATWCAPCVAELASFEALADALSDTGVRFLFVTPEDPEPVRRFLRRYRTRLPVFLEAEPMPEAWGLEAVPTTWVVDAGGRIVLKHRGAARWDTAEMERFLRYLSGQAGAAR